MIAISLLVARDFFCPVVHIRRRHAATAAAVPMPLTSVYKNSRFPTWKNDVRFARQAQDVNSIPQSTREQRFSQAKLGRGVRTAHARHDAAARCLVERVRHSEALSRCGLPKYTRTVVGCWRKETRDNFASAGRTSSQRLRLYRRSLVDAPFPQFGQYTQRTSFQVIGVDWDYALVVVAP